jgi:regulator of sigma D
MESKKSLDEFTDREMLLFILSNQVKIFRQIQYLQNEIKGEGHKPLGHYENTFKELIGATRDVLNQADDYLNQEDTEKGFLQL